MKTEYCRVCGSSISDGELTDNEEFVCKPCADQSDIGTQCLLCDTFVIFGTEVEHQLSKCK